MTFTAPAFWYAAIAVAAGVAALHLILARRPHAVPFPTARFVPERRATASARTLRPADLLLLLTRALIVLALGAGLARPVLTTRQTGVARVILADVSRAAMFPAVRDRVRSLFRDGDVLVAFDSLARQVRHPDSLRPGIASVGSLSAALAAGLRAAPAPGGRSDSVALVIVAPAGAVEMDSATGPIRDLWPGRIRLVPVGAASAAVARPAVVAWRNGARPQWSVPRPRVDTAGAVVARGLEPLVAPIPRRWRFPPDSIVNSLIVARWNDGEPAAVERELAPVGPDSARPGASPGCVRAVAIDVDSTGDLPIRPQFRALAARLRGPCGTIPASPGAGTAAMLSIVRRGPARLARGDELPRTAAAATTPLAALLVGAALLLALVEPVVRRAARS